MRLAEVEGKAVLRRHGLTVPEGLLPLETVMGPALTVERDQPRRLAR